MKRIINLIFAVAICASLSSAQTFFTSGKLRYEVVDETNKWVRVVVKNPNNPDDIYQNITTNDFSATVTNGGVEYTVLGVGPGAFQKATFSENSVIRLPEGFIYIDNGAFDGAVGVSLRLPSTLTMLAPMALGGNKFRFLAVDDNNPEFKRIAVSSQSRDVSTITNKAGDKIIAVAGSMVINFDNGATYVTQYTIPETITEINEYAFYKHPNFTRVIIPTSVTKIGDAAFYECEKLTSVSLPNPNVQLGKSVWASCVNLASVSLPEGMEKLARHTFYMCGLESITLPEGMKSVGFMCFGSNNIKTINLPSTLEKIDSCCFQNNAELVSVNLKNVKQLEQFAFMGRSALKTYTCNGQLERIGSSAFCRTALVDAQLPEGLIRMDGNVFFRTTSLQTITIPSTVESIEFTPIVGCTSVKEVKVAEGNTHFVELDSCLYEINAAGNPICLVSVPQGRENTVLIVPDGVTEIGRQAVREVPMTEVWLPKSVQTVSHSAFSSVTSATKVTCMAVNPPEVDMEGSFFSDEVFANATLYVPINSVGAYQAADGWKEFQHIEGVETGDDPQPGVVGDLNGDGVVDVADVNICINIILEIDNDPDVKALADLNGDGVVDVADVNAIINIILE
ncbi:MAG: leucine-rich repeat protein [Muribaculaceae bacterium]|nr:leucine-rich repeat protein [Muribaculaceae bacterium]